MKLISKPVIIAATATVMASTLGAYVWHEENRPPLLEFYVFALKSGRSIFIRTPDDQRILIDGGGNSQIIQELTKILPFYTRRINKIIVTNTEGKNVSGLIDILERYNVDMVYLPKFTLQSLDVASSTDKIYETFVEKVIEKKVQVVEVEMSSELTLGEEVGKKVIGHILFPTTPNLFEYSKASAPEILFNIKYGNNSVLFMGDASKKVQKFVASSSEEIISNSDVLIVSHSAVPANMSTELINVARPYSLVYEKAVTKGSTSKLKPKITKKKGVSDPLATILGEDRFNLKEVGTVKIISDGENIEIKKPRD